MRPGCTTLGNVTELVAGPQETTGDGFGSLMLLLKFRCFFGERAGKSFKPIFAYSGMELSISRAAPFCGNPFESILHAIRDFPLIQHGWYIDDFDGCAMGMVSLNLSCWLQFLKDNLDTRLLEYATVLCWAIWNSRNKLIFGEDGTNITDPVGMARSILVEFQDICLGMKLRGCFVRRKCEL
ncbi:hypothetical protein CDL12_21445 [Handroanthus impetiginosus]|uniref:Uncharacterized protein n=1 Tax=Handroanthus impetiginosus TaxID=429701 RepID=A0A2G9GL23_9LAMI|nr:hypothetical protein CDL12_21445 [Handroanthus impetiginosus]